MNMETFFCEMKLNSFDNEIVLKVLIDHLFISNVQSVPRCEYACRELSLSSRHGVFECVEGKHMTSHLRKSRIPKQGHSGGIHGSRAK